MVYKSELIKRGELKVGDVYRKELLEFYALDNDCMLVVPNSPSNIYLNDSESDYKVKEIINSCKAITGENRGMTESYYDSIAIIEKA